MILHVATLVGFEFEPPVEHEARRPGLVGDVQLAAAATDLAQTALDRVQVAADLTVDANLAIAALVGHRNCHRIFVDIQAHIMLCRSHALVFISGYYGFMSQSCG